MTLHGAEASSRTYAKNGAVCACCHRRAFVKGASAAALATLTSRRNASAQPASPSADKPFRIDVHHHLSSPGFVEAIRSRKTGQIPLENWTPAKSLEDMDKGAVATAMLSISEPSVNFGDDAAALAPLTNARRWQQAQSAPFFAYVLLLASAPCSVIAASLVTPGLPGPGTIRLSGFDRSKQEREEPDREARHLS